MRLRFGVQNAKYIFFSNDVLKARKFNLNQRNTTSSFANNYEHNNGSNNEGWDQESNWKLPLKCIAAVGLTSLAADNLLSAKDLLADENEDPDVEHEIINKENR